MIEPTFAEARDALNQLDQTIRAQDIPLINIIRSVLERAAREAAAWEKLEKASKRLGLHFVFDLESGSYGWTCMIAEPDRVRPVRPVTRLVAAETAAEDAAAWEQWAGRQR